VLAFADGAQSALPEGWTRNTKFEVLAPRADDTKVLLYEVYKDDAAFDVHWNGPSTKRALEETKGMILKLSGTRCTPIVEWGKAAAPKADLIALLPRSAARLCEISVTGSEVSTASAGFHAHLAA
jgi:(4S)-4-hydroxy-5-phosphonooxypentane-2,3-dione isomerase